MEGKEKRGEEGGKRKGEREGKRREKGRGHAPKYFGLEPLLDTFVV